MRVKIFSFLVVALLIVGVSAAVNSTLHPTTYTQHASNQFQDLNKGAEITTTLNADGTMGPLTWWGNFSNSLPSFYLGSLNFQVTDPGQGRRPTDTQPSISPTHTLPTQAQKNDNDNNKPSTTPSSTPNGPQSVKSLLITITKVEVHLAHLATPGQRITLPISPEDITHTPPSASPTPKTNQIVDKWETLNTNTPQTLDLVQLGNNKTLSSLGITKLAGGLYTEVRLYISKATATLSDGTTVTLSILGHENTVRVIEPFDVISGKTTAISLDFDAQNSVVKAGDVYLLKPVVARFDQQNQP